MPKERQTSCTARIGIAPQSVSPKKHMSSRASSRVFHFTRTSQGTCGSRFRVPVVPGTPAGRAPPAARRYHARPDAAPQTAAPPRTPFPRRRPRTDTSRPLANAGAPSWTRLLWRVQGGVVPSPAKRGCHPERSIRISARQLLRRADVIQARVDEPEPLRKNCCDLATSYRLRATGWFCQGFRPRYRSLVPHSTRLPRQHPQRKLADLPLST